MHPAIVVIHYRHQHLTASCLTALLQADADTPIFCVDNGSHNGSLAFLQAQFPQVAFVAEPVNRGFGGGCNAGIRAAQQAGYQHILILNNDIHVDQPIAQQFLAVSERYQHQAILGGTIEAEDGSNWFSGGHFSLWSARGQHFTTPHPEGPVDFLTGCMLWLPGPVLERLGGFAEEAFLYLEDVELCLRAQGLGIPLIYTPEIRIWHRVSASTGGAASPLSIYYQNRNRWWILRRYGKWYHWLSFLPLYGLGYLKRQIQLRGEARRASQQALQDGWQGHWGYRAFDTTQISSDKYINSF